MAEIQLQNADLILPASAVNLPSTLAASSTAYSAIIKAQGYHEISASILSSQNGTLTIQRYLDADATIPQGAAISATLTGGTQATVNIPSDGTPFEYAQVTVSNSSGSTANLSNAEVVLSQVQAGGYASVTATSIANTSSGVSTFFASAQLATVTSVKSSAGNLYGFTFQNPNTSAAYIQFFDLATGSVTLGSTTPKLAYWVPAGGVYDYIFTGEEKVSFANAISIAATTTATGSTAPSTGILTNILYK